MKLYLNNDEIGLTVMCFCVYVLNASPAPANHNDLVTTKTELLVVALKFGFIFFRVLSNKPEVAR